MSVKAKAVQTLYRMGRISKDGVRQAVADRLISNEEYFSIVGEMYDSAQRVKGG